MEFLGLLQKSEERNNADITSNRTGINRDISSEDADKIIEQIEKCEDWYKNIIGYRKKYRLFLRSVSGKKKRFDNYARTKLILAKIMIYDCKGQFNLNKV